MCQECGDKFGISAAYNNISVVFISLGQWDKSLEFNRKALQLYLELGNKQGESIVYCNIADIYRNQGQFRLALENLERAIEIGQKINITHHLSSYYIDKARLLYHLDRYDEALKCNAEGLGEAQKIGRKEYIFLGKLFDIKIRTALYLKKEQSLPATIKDELTALLEVAMNDEQTAEVHYHLWRLTGETEAARQAEMFYRKLARFSRRQDIAARLKELDLFLNG